MQPKIKISIVGITGYTGLEVLRLALAHPNVEIKHLIARQNIGEDISNIYSHLANYNLKISGASLQEAAQDSDVVFLALPHKTAQDAVAEIHKICKVIDLSADYRLKDQATYEKYYCPHNHPELLAEAAYGAPEWNKNAIAKAQIVANPGCFALLGQTLLYPFAGNIAHADIFAITGSSGAGKSASEGTHHPVRNHNIKSYNINKHRHIPEIMATAQIGEEQLNFAPSSGPFTRGIFMNGYIRLKNYINLENSVQTAYSDKPFIRIKDTVQLADIVGSNFCDISFSEGNDGTIIAQGALDNLVKGAAGCAVQNMNIMFGLDETTGLKMLSPLYP